MPLMISAKALKDPATNEEQSPPKIIRMSRKLEATSPSGNGSQKILSSKSLAVTMVDALVTPL